MNNYRNSILDITGTSTSDVSIVVMLVGLPASGKSTFIETCNSHRYDRLEVVSTDGYFDKVAKENNVSYQHAFNNTPFSDAEYWMWKNFGENIQNKKSFFIDRTNLSVKSRKKFLDLIPASYYKIAVVFNLDEQQRLHQSDTRYKETGKMVPSHAVNSMIRSFEPVSGSEGFDSVYNIKNFD